ncbi:MAG: ABC transporter permease [Elusimicrobiota bacterium]
MNQTLLAFARKELSQTLRDVSMRMVLFVMPVIQLSVFGLALKTEVSGVRLNAVYEPSDRAMARVVERFYSAGWFVPAAGEDAALIAPPGGLTRALGRGDAQVQFLVDATNASKARAVEAYARSILAEVFESPGGPVSLDVRVLYNPAMESSAFMVPGVMGMILCLITIILTSMSLAKERESGTFESIVSAPLSDLEILLGKTLPYVLLGLVDGVLVVVAGVVLFDVPLRGPLWMLAASNFVFIITTVSVGTLISTIAYSQQQAMLGSFLFLFPAMLLSGMMFPVENMPWFLRWVAYADPLMYFIALMREVMLKGGDLGVVGRNLFVLALMACGAAWLSFNRFRQTLD